MANRTYVCATCGHCFEQSGPGRPRSRCYDCAREPTFDYGHCETCGTELSGRRFSRRRFCSRKCRRSAKRQLSCKWCDGAFFAPETTRYTCSNECELAWRSFRQSGGKSSPWSPKWPDIVRPTPEIDALQSAIDEADRLRRARFISKQCDCGVWFMWDRRVGGVPWARCETCAEQKKRDDKKRTKDRRRARKVGAYVDDVNRAYIFERDRYRCQICHGRLAMKQKSPHPKSPTIDHIIPLAAGGTHEPSNAQAAHFICNARKRDNAANDQLLLVG